MNDKRLLYIRLAASVAVVALLSAVFAAAGAFRGESYMTATGIATRVPWGGVVFFALALQALLFPLWFVDWRRAWPALREGAKRLAKGPGAESPAAVMAAAEGDNECEERRWPAWVPAFAQKKWFRVAAAAVISVGVVLLQMHSLWNSYGRQPDEAEVFQYSVGFLGGDLNPHWFGYGSFGMYLIGLVYLLLYPVMRLFGGIESMRLYAMQLFYNDFFLLTARFVIALLAVWGVWLCVRMLRQMRVAAPVRALAFVLMTTSCVAVYFANFIRTDYLVSFFTLATVYFCANSHKRSSLYGLAVVVPAAICCKISALPLGLLMAGYVAWRWWRRDIVWRDVLGVTLLTVACLLAFQPYSNVFERGLRIISVGADGYGVAKKGKNLLLPMNGLSLPARLSTFYGFCKQYNVHVYLYLLPLVLFFKSKWKWTLPALIAFVLTLAPYCNSVALRHKWFVPAYVLIIFLGILGAYCFVEFVAKKLLPRRPKAWGWITFAVLGALFGGTVLTTDIGQLQRKYKAKAHPLEAERWITEHLLNDEQVVLDMFYWTGITQIYNPNDHATSRVLSDCFKYNRHENVFLCSLFDEYLDSYYLDDIGLDSVKGVEGFNINRSRKVDYKRFFAGKYFVMKPNRVRSFVESGKPERVAEFYKFVMSHQQVKRFGSIAIYRISPDGEAGE